MWRASEAPQGSRLRQHPMLCADRLMQMPMRMRVPMLMPMARGEECWPGTRQEGGWEARRAETRMRASAGTQTRRTSGVSASGALWQRVGGERRHGGRPMERWGRGRRGRCPRR